MKTVFIAYLAVVNIVALFLYAIDKSKAKSRSRGIPERVLLGVAFFGGALGAMLGMQVFRHKTKKMKFILGVPFCLLVNAAVVWLLFPILK